MSQNTKTEQQQPIQHTAQCLAQQALVAAYDRQWPYYCGYCSGVGQFNHPYDPSPAGVGLSPGTMDDWEPCPKCAAKGKCPRCGLQNIVKEEDYEEFLDTVPCTDCGFTFKDGGRPEIECYCYESQQIDVYEIHKDLYFSDAVDYFNPSYYYSE